MSKHILHDHLDGGLRPSTAKEIAHELGYEPVDSVDDASIYFDRSNCESLEDYLEAFTHTIALMQSFDNLHRIAYEAAIDMSNNGIKYYESRYAPFYSVNSNLSPTDVIDAINAGFQQAQSEVGIVSGLILCGMRHDPQNVSAVADLAVEVKDKIIGFDIAGPEYNYLPSLYAESFMKVQNAGINITIHAGEGDGVNSIQDALDNGAKRIGHGVRIIEDINEDGSLGKTADYILQNQIPLEICITSNIHTNMYSEVTEHPISKLYNLEFNISLNTDNRLMSNTSVKKEIEMAKIAGIKDPEKLLKFSASDSFLN